MSGWKQSFDFNWLIFFPSRTNNKLSKIMLKDSLYCHPSTRIVALFSVTITQYDAVKRKSILFKCIFLSVYCWWRLPDTRSSLAPIYSTFFCDECVTNNPTALATSVRIYIANQPTERPQNVPSGWRLICLNGRWSAAAAKRSLMEHRAFGDRTRFVDVVAVVGTMLMRHRLSRPRAFHSDILDYMCGLCTGFTFFWWGRKAQWISGRLITIYI